MRVIAMRGLVARAAVVAVAAVALVVPAVAASASQTPVTNWSPTTSAGTYDYGTVSAGQTVSKTFTLTNSGGSATSALTITVTGSAFTKTADSCTGTSLGPGTSCTVTVSYAAASAGQNDTGTLTAAANKPAAAASLTLLGASKSAAAITGVTVYYVASPFFQGAAVTGTGFLPDTRISFTVSFAVTETFNINNLNEYPFVFTDASGAFNSGTDPSTTNTYIELGCEANTVTVTATDGTNTATGTFDIPAC